MTQIKINVNDIRSVNQHIKSVPTELSSIENRLDSLRSSIDRRITQRTNINQQLKQTIKTINELERKTREIHSFIDESMDQYVKADKKASSHPFEKEKSLLDHFVDGIDFVGDIKKGFDKGMAKAVISTATGIWEGITNPLETAKGIGYAATHLDETLEATWDSIEESWKRDVINGDEESASEWFGNAFGQVALGVVGTKGVDKAAKVAKVAMIPKGTGLETRGYKPLPGERVTTKEEWKLLDRERRIETNYSKPPIYEKNYKIVKSNPKYYTLEGEINWPPNRGVLGEPESVILKPGTVIDRFGYEGGTFVSPYGVPYEMRALAPETYLKPYQVYVVKKPIEVQAGKIAPWFDEPGLGIQYELNQSVKKLIDQNIIGRIGK